MWKRLDELNKEFNETKKSKKDSKKMSKSLIIMQNNFFNSEFVNFFYS